MPTVSPGPRIGRRRAMTIIATAAGAALWPKPAASGGPRRFEWTGSALGARAHIVLHHHDRAAWRALGAAAFLATLPRGCPLVGLYYYCGGVYYQSTVQNGATVYVVVTP